jgi:4-hydroxy-3-methylbut-2-enyl diphosphate reductase
MFNVGESVGICGATSTPMWLMEEVKQVLESY